MFLHFLYFSGPWKKWPQMAPKGTLEDFVPTNPDLEVLADILGRTDLDFENLHFFHFVDPKFLDVQVPRSQDSHLVVNCNAKTPAHLDGI